MLTKLTPTIVTNKCPGYYNGSTCNQEVAINFATLELGQSAGSRNIKDNILLPICTRCSGRETLFRYWGILDSSIPSYKQKAAINFLGKKLKEAGQLNAGCSTDIMAEITDPPVILDAYPTGDGTL